jgi:hypothetical protein
MPAKKFVMTKMSTTAVSLFFGFLVLMVTAVAVFQISQSFREEMRAQAHSGLVLGQIRSLLALMVDAETAERGFALTGDEKFLEPYVRAEKGFNEIYESLKRNTADNDAHQKTLVEAKRLIDLEMDFLSRMIQGVKDQHRKNLKVRLVVQQGDQKVVMDEIRTQLARMEHLEQKIFAAREAQAEKTSQLLDTAMYVSLAFIIVLITIAVATLISDIVERGEAEKVIVGLKDRAEEASRMKSQFLANMSHEIRTPLNGIHGMIELLVKTPLNPEQDEYLSALKDSSISLLAIINDVLDFSKIEAGMIELESVPFQVDKIVASCVKVLDYSAKHRSLTLKTDLATELPSWVIGDGLRLRQILLNLIGNAVKFSQAGSVFINVKVVSHQLSRVHLRFEVIDSGVGFDDATKARLFKVFSQADQSTTRKFGGTGLGLAICKQLVEVMGGEIGADSVPGHGATFWFELPFDVSSVRLKQAERAELNVEFSKDKPPVILVVEDHLVNQKVVTSLLQKMGCRFEVANHGGEALERMKTQNYDLVLMDCHMPVLDGYETARQIRSGGVVLNPKIVIIAATANVTSGEKEKCAAAGMDDYISKPMSFVELRAKIHHWISVGSADDKKSA